MSSIELNLVTLNAWGVPVGSANVDERIAALAENLAAGEYDVVLLQEIWMKRSFETIKKRVEQTYPYSHFFRSHIIGSGMCIFSRHPIVHTLFHPFAVNGYYDRVFFHGDVLCGKGIGLAVLRVGEFTVNVYVTHLHADYMPGETAWPCSYEVQRAAQAFELSRFITVTSSNSCDMALLGGDLNCRPDSLGYRVVRSLTGLEDTFDSRDTSDKETNWSTCTRPDNSYFHTSPLQHHRDGQRIDYLMVRAANSAAQLIASRFALAFRKIPEKPQLNFSDHEGVRCTVKLSRVLDSQAADKANQTERERQRLKDERQALAELNTVVHRGFEEISRQRSLFLSLVAACVALLFVAVALGSCCQVASVLLTMLVALALAYSIYMLLAGTRSERHALENVLQDINVLQRTCEKA